MNKSGKRATVRIGLPARPSDKQTIKIMLPPAQNPKEAAATQVPAPPPQAPAPQQTEAPITARATLPIPKVPQGAPQQQAIAPPAGAPAVVAPAAVVPAAVVPAAAPQVTAPVVPPVAVPPVAAAVVQPVSQGVPTDQVAPHPATPMSPNDVMRAATELNSAVSRVEQSIGRIDYVELGKQVATNVDFKSEISTEIKKKQGILDLVLASIALLTSIGVVIALLRI